MAILAACVAPAKITFFMSAPRKDSLARFVLTPTKTTSGATLNQQWSALATFLRGPGSALARWLAVAQMHGIYRQVKLRKEQDLHGGRNLADRSGRHFVERVCAETGLSRPTIYNYVDRARSLMEVLGPPMLKEMLSGREPIANDENILIKIAQLPSNKALKVVEVYMTGKGEAAASRLLERSLHRHRLSELTSAHEPKLRGGLMVESTSASEAGEQRNVVLFGDALVHLRETVPPETVQTCITSPPFYGQRDFGTMHWFGGNSTCRHSMKVAHGPLHSGRVTETKSRRPAASQSGQTAVTYSCSRCAAWYGQIGQEPDVGMYIDHLVTIFREVRRVLRSDGVCWIEIGDTYNSGTTTESDPAPYVSNGAWARTRDRRRASASDVPVKSLLLIPQRLAVALQEDGWIVRATVVWQKLAALPESVTDRPTRSQTTILMLAKNADYYYDYLSIMEPVTGGTHTGGKAVKDARPGIGIKANTSFNITRTKRVAARNCRDIWSFPAGRFPGAHAATFPPELPARCIRASTSERGACAGCGAPWRRRTLRVRGASSDSSSDLLPAPETIGWEPTCVCGVAETVPCLVLDCFAGSGTTLMMAKQLKRDYLGIEINEKEYRPLIEKRLKDALVPAPAPSSKRRVGGLVKAKAKKVSMARSRSA